MKTPAIKPSQRIKDREERKFVRAVFPMSYDIHATRQTEFPGGMDLKDWLIGGALGLALVGFVIVIWLVRP